MAKKQPKFQIARAFNGELFARYIASNGKELWRTSETYKRKRGVINAINKIGIAMDDEINIEDLTV